MSAGDTGNSRPVDRRECSCVRPASGELKGEEDCLPKLWINRRMTSGHFATVADKASQSRILVKTSFTAIMNYILKQ